MRVVVVRPEKITHALFTRMLSDSGAAVSVATHAAEALAKMRKAPCEVAIVSLNLPDLDGLELLRRINHGALARKVVVLQDRTDPCTVYALNHLPVTAVVDPHRCDETQLQEIVTKVLRGEPAKGCKPIKVEMRNDIFSRLTDREFEVLTLMGGGSTVAEAAARLGVSENTINTHRHRIASKLRLKSRQDLIWKAIVCGAVRLTPTGQQLPGLSCLRIKDAVRATAV